MIFILIGFLAGLLMGITGAGGAIIAIPLFQIFLGSSLKDATVLSLITVILGSAVNLPGKMKSVNWKIAAVLVLSGSVANFMFLPLKHSAPEWIIVLLLSGIGCFSIWTVWRPVLKDAISEKKKIPVLVTVSSGLVLGLVTTLTGLGGGILLVPLLLQIFRMSYEDALPTSLASILLVSLSSLLVQYGKTSVILNGVDALLLTMGCLMAVGLLRFILRLLDQDQRLLLRRSIFTVATIASLLKIISQTF